MDGELSVVTDTNPVRVDLACGQTPREGFTGYDLHAPETDRVKRLDLLRFPWPLADASVDELHCSHFIEHIPMAETADGQDLLLAFFDECFRVLKPGGTMTVIWPSLKSVRAFQDPTHRRFIPGETMGYLSAGWRKANALDHYRVACDFEIRSVAPTIHQDTALRSAEAQAWMVQGMWDRTVDWHAVLAKPAAP